MADNGSALGVDFGTSNSAAGFLDDGRPRLIELAPQQQTLPTTFFFDFSTRQTLMGQPANNALLDGAEGRFMRALKRVLGTGLMHEKRQILNERVTFVDIIARFLSHIKARAEAETGKTFSRVLSGRPVVFHGENDPREAQAEADLRACYLAAGFKDVQFMAEPEAAARAGGALDQPEHIGLIVDVGGGTSDFSVFRAKDAQVDILANHGVRIGGTDFDRTINIAEVMPLLGKGGQVRKVMGAGLTPVPTNLFNDLATWEKIPFLYTPQNRRMVDDLVKLSDDPTRLQRLAEVLQHELGHELAFATERGKIAANGADEIAKIKLDVIEAGLAAPISAGQIGLILSDHASALSKGALRAVEMASLAPRDVDRVIYVGGSSLMTVVTDTMNEIFPNSEHSFTEVFTAVADGLALSAR